MHLMTKGLVGSLYGLSLITDKMQNEQVSRHSTTLTQNCCKYRINTKDGLIINCIFVILVNVFLSILF